MRRSLILATGLAICLALPAASLADPPSDNAKKKDQQGQQHQGQQHQGQARGGQKGAGGSAAQGPGGGARDNGAGAFHRSRGQVQAQQGGQTAQEAQPFQGGGARAFVGAAARGAPTASPNVQTQTQAQTRGRQTARRLPTIAPPLGDWNRNVRGTQRDQAGQQWRQGHQGWDSNARWRQDPNWWRRDSGFRLYIGPRNGYFFIPGLGYVSAPQEYRQHYWRPGDYLPQWFWRYQVRDYDRYGLPQPPDGCAWIWVDGDVALVDPSDGYILDIERNVC